MRKIVLLVIILMVILSSLVTASFLTWFRDLFGFTGKVVVNVDDSIDYCPEITELQKKVDAFELKSRDVLKGAGSCLDNNDCDGMTCLDEDRDGFYNCGVELNV